MYLLDVIKFPLLPEKFPLSNVDGRLVSKGGKTLGGRRRKNS